MEINECTKYYEKLWKKWMELRIWKHLQKQWAESWGELLMMLLGLPLSNVSLKP